MFVNGYEFTDKEVDLVNDNECFTYGWRDDDDYEDLSIVVNEGYVKNSFSKAIETGFVSMGTWWILVWGSCDMSEYDFRRTYKNGDIILLDSDDYYDEFVVNSYSECISILDKVLTGEIQKTPNPNYIL